MISFAFEETMTGTYQKVAGSGTEEWPFTVHFRAQAPGLLSYARTHLLELTGTVKAPGLAKEAEVRGTLFVSLLLHGVIRYEFGFTGDNGQPYRYLGQKDIKVSELLRSMTNLSGVIRDSKLKDVARVKLHFDLKTQLLPMLFSFRPQLFAKRQERVAARASAS